MVYVYIFQYFHIFIAVIIYAKLRNYLMKIHIKSFLYNSSTLQFCWKKIKMIDCNQIHAKTISSLLTSWLCDFVVSFSNICMFSLSILDFNNSDSLNIVFAVIRFSHFHTILYNINLSIVPQMRAVETLKGWKSHRVHIWSKCLSFFEIGFEHIEI